MRLWVRAALVLSVLLFVLGLAEDFEDPKAAAVRVCGFALIASAAVSWRSLRISWTPLDVAVLIWLWTELLATILSSAPVLSLVGDSVQREGFSTSLAMAGVYLGARFGTKDADQLARTLDVGVLAIVLASAYALLQAAGLDLIRWAPRIIGGASIPVGRPAATLGHATVLGVATGAGGAMALARALTPRRGRWAWGLAAAICAGATLVTLTRAAWLGLSAGVVVVALGSLGAVGSRARVPIAIAGGALITLFVVAVLARGASTSLADRWLELLHPDRGSVASRIEIWRAAIRAWRTRPWFGWGPDSFGMIFSHYQPAAFWRVEWGLMPFHAHSIYLQTLATRGAVGLASAASWLAALLVCARRVWRRSPAERAPLAAMLGGLAALGVAGAFGALGIAGQTLIVVISGMTSARAAPVDAEPSRWAGRVAWLAAGVATLWAVADLSASAAEANAQLWLDRVDTLSGRDSRMACERALVAAERAATLAPFDDRIARLHADALFATADMSFEPAPLMLAATREARRAIRLAPERSENFLRLGRVLGARAAMGDRASLTEAREALDRAARLAPTDARVLVECARMDMIMGDVGEARALATHAVQLYPDDGASLAMLGRALARSGDPRAGADMMRRAMVAEWRGDLAGRQEVAAELHLLRE